MVDGFTLQGKAVACSQQTGRAEERLNEEGGLGCTPVASWAPPPPNRTHRTYLSLDSSTKRYHTAHTTTSSTWGLLGYESPAAEALRIDIFIYIRVPPMSSFPSKKERRETAAHLMKSQWRPSKSDLPLFAWWMGAREAHEWFDPPPQLQSTLHSKWKRPGKQQCNSEMMVCKFLHVVPSIKALINSTLHPACTESLTISCSRADVKCNLSLSPHSISRYFEAVRR